MVNYKLHENGWTVMLDDKFSFKTATQDDINQIAVLLATNTLVVARNQSLTIQDEIRVEKMFKNPQQFYTDDQDGEHSNHRYDADVPESEQYLLRVTGELNEHGLPGIAGHKSEMMWHSNDQTTPDRRPLVWLYGVKGTKGSRTSWNNNIMSYNGLDESLRKPLENLKLVMLADVSLREDQPNGTDIVEGYYPNLVMENIAGKKGFYFPFLQIAGFKDVEKDEGDRIIDWLSKHTIQDQYCYHHDWEDGDVVIAEQWLGIHKRWPFEEIEGRLLHRGTFDFPDQHYK